MNQLLNWVTIGSMAFMTLLILIQTRGASLGAGFGGSGEIHTTRRGVDKTLHQITVLTAIVFVLSIVFGLLVA